MVASWGAWPQGPLQVWVASVTELVTQITQSRCQAASPRWPHSPCPGTGRGVGGGVGNAQTSRQQRRAMSRLLPTLGLGRMCLYSAPAEAQPSPCLAPTQVHRQLPRVTILALVGMGQGPWLGTWV